MNMKAWVIEQAGGPDAFRIRDLPIPPATPSRVLIRVRAFGLNRSEWFTRRGESPSVAFPRVLGIECVGEVVDAGGLPFAKGQRVAAMMNGMGRAFDGSYAEYTSVPASCVFPLETALPWERLGALPEMLQTTHGSLHTALEVESGQSLLVRGGTSSIGLAAIALARAAGLSVGATTRNSAKSAMLEQAGATEVWVDDGAVSAQVKATRSGPYDRVLELIGATTLLDSLRCVRRGGIVCMTGILGGEWVLREFEPMGDIPTAVKLTSYSGGAQDIGRDDLQRYVSLVERGELSLKTGPVFDFRELRQAHTLMDENRASGKIVVRVDAEPL